jgi:hypothetical protein
MHWVAADAPLYVIVLAPLALAALSLAIGKTLSFSSAGIARVVDRKSDPALFWGTILALCILPVLVGIGVGGVLVADASRPLG